MLGLAAPGPVKIWQFPSTMFSCLSHLKYRNGLKPTFKFINRRKCSMHNFSESLSKTLTANGHICHYAGSMPETSYPQTYSVIQSSGLQHWFKNWQELRKYKLTASTFGGAVGFWPRRRVQLWLEKLGAIEPFTGNLATCWSNIKEEEALESSEVSSLERDIMIIVTGRDNFLSTTYSRNTTLDRKAKS